MPSDPEVVKYDSVCSFSLSSERRNKILVNIIVNKLKFISVHGQSLYCLSSLYFI